MSDRFCFKCGRPMRQRPDGELACVEGCTRTITVTATPEWLERQKRLDAIERRGEEGEHG